MTQELKARVICECLVGGIYLRGFGQPTLPAVIVAGEKGRVRVLPRLLGVLFFYSMVNVWDAPMPVSKTWSRACINGATLRNCRG